MKYFIWLLLLLVSLMFCSVAAAQVRLNEIYPGGSPEWIELYNTASSEANLVDWYIDDIVDAGASPKKISITIPALGYQILEFTSVFNNSGGDSVRLLDASQTEIDRFDYTQSVSLTDYFSRCPDGGNFWQVFIQSTKLNSNNTLCPTPTQVPIATPEVTPEIGTTVYPTPTESPTQIVKHISQIYLSEIMVYPDNDNEWVEIYNNNNNIVDLVDWYLDDKEASGSTPKKFSLILPPKSYGVIELSNHIFNNDQDSVRLLNQEQSEQDSLEYNNPQKGKSYSRQAFTNDTVWCFTTVSKNIVNNSCPSTDSILGAIDVLEISPTEIIISTQNQPTQSLILPSRFKLNEQFYELEKPKTLGAKITKPNTKLISEFYFWQQCTKIALWLNFVLNLLLIIGLSFFLPEFYHLLSGWVGFSSSLIEKK